MHKNKLRRVISSRYKSGVRSRANCRQGFFSKLRSKLYRFHRINLRSRRKYRRRFWNRRKIRSFFKKRKRSIRKIKLKRKRKKFFFSKFFFFKRSLKVPFFYSIDYIFSIVFSVPLLLLDHVKDCFFSNKLICSLLRTFFLYFFLLISYMRIIRNMDFDSFFFFIFHLFLFFFLNWFFFLVIF